MNQITLEKLNNNIFHIQKELDFLRSFVIGIIGKDIEGEYKSEFVEKILKANKERATHAFKDKKTFLFHLSHNDSNCLQ